MKMERDQVLDAINTAFGELSVPNPGTILRPVDSKIRSSAETFRSELAGKTWQSLPSNFLAEQWSSFGYLSPEAYRYYLPSLLTEALKEFRDDSDFVHSVVFDLRPSFWSLYYNGEDQDMRDQQSAFTVSQYHAVCDFLGLIFDELPRLHHLAAQALHWGWNQHDTPALQAANKYYHELRHFSYPEPEAPEPELMALCEEISTAFAATPYPGDSALCGSEQGDEPAENAMELRGVRWQSAHPALLARCYSALSFLSDSGFRYFLPAFLLADLLGYALGYESNADPVFDLTHGFYDASKDQFDVSAISSQVETALEGLGLSGQEAQELLRQHQEKQKQVDWRAYSMQRFVPFNRNERMAIIHYLEFQEQNEYPPTSIHQALEGYWRPSVQTSAT